MSKKMPTKQAMPMKRGNMVKLECLEETSIQITDTLRELYEDGFGYVYEVEEDKAKALLEQYPKNFRVVN